MGLGCAAGERGPSSCTAVRRRRCRERAGPRARKARTMSGGEVVCSGWLRKSPPEKKLKRYVSRARPPLPSPGGSRADCSFSLVPIRSL